MVGTWDVLYRVWVLSGHVHLGLIAAGVAFFGMFSIFPAIAAIIAIFGLLADPALVESQMVLLDDFIPADAYTLVQSQFDRLRSAQTETLGLATAISVMVALWSARAGVSALIQGLNAIHRRPNRHGVIHAIQAIIMTLVLILIAVTAVLTVIVVPIMLALVNLPTATGWLLEGLRWIVSLAVLMAALSLFYRYGPNRVRFGSGMVTPGAALVIVFWLGSSAGFSYYTQSPTEAEFDVLTVGFGTIQLSL